MVNRIICTAKPLILERNALSPMTYNISTRTSGVLIMGIYACLLGVSSAEARITSGMEFGSSGVQVTELQQYLARNSEWYPSGLVTGYFGELTQRATERFQVAQGIVSSGTPETTGYGRVGPTTGARINALMGNVPTGDVWSPLMTKEVVGVDSDSATISWTTNELAQSRVMYGTSWPFLYSTALSMRAGTYDRTPQITLTGLKPDTTYYYVRESVDAYGNITWTTKETFKTNK
jgi:peptidoglycan hydrolase-like protein with peptidoglycan-binding domain